MQSSRKFRLAVALMAVLALMMAAASISSGAPASPGTPRVQTTCVDSPSATGTTTVNLPITIQGLSDLGAAAYTLYLEAPSANHACWQQCWTGVHGLVYWNRRRTAGGQGRYC
jgi:ABC-type phosphate transport system substrate-binding protein